MNSIQEESAAVTTIPEGDLPHISVVVIGRNEGERLTRCLESIRAADYPQDRLDLIYVDSDSADESCAVADGFGANVIPIKPKHRSAASGRNAGLAVAKHDLIQFLDGDTILQKRWLRRACEAIVDPQFACVFGHREEIAPTATIFNYWSHHDWYAPPGLADSCGGDAMFRREVLEHAKGYDESLIAGEEADLCYRIRRERGMLVLSIDEPMTLHDMNMTKWRQYWRRCTRTGHAYAEIGGRYPEMQRYRRARWRNLFYAAGTPTALAASVVLWTLWPAVGWLLLVALATVRNAARLRRRVGTFRGALLYSIHHYLAKTPIALGQCNHWYRAAFGRRPRELIEYRT